MELARIALPGGPNLTFHVPEPVTEENVAHRQFDAACRLICQEWRKRRLSRTPDRFEWLVAACYALLIPILDGEWDELIDARIAKFGRYSRRPHDANAFQRGVMAVFAHDDGTLDPEKPRGPKLLAPEERRRVSKAIWYAARHYVPLQFVDIFLAQVPSRRLMSVGPQELEPGNDEWIAQQRAIDPGSEERGRYPKHINDRAEELDLLNEKFPRVEVDDDEWSFAGVRHQPLGDIDWPDD